MKLNTLIALAITSIAFASCSGPEEFTITGQAEGMEGKTIFLQKFEKGQPVSIDSATIGTDGAFTIGTKLPYTDFYQLYIDPKNTMIFVGDSVGELKFTSAPGLTVPKNIEGQEDTKILYDFDADLKVIMMKGDSIVRLGKSGKIPRETAILKLQDVNTEALSFLHSFVDKNANSPASMAALNRMNPMQDLAYFKKVLAGMEKRMPKSEYYSFLKMQIDQIEAQGGQGAATQPEQATDAGLAVGSIPPAISLPDPKGKVHTLAEFKGKVVLIDFWASWCGPCRNENPNVVKVYNKYHSKGFEILSVSLDKAADAWTNAIAEDKLTWTHVSELKFWQSKVVEDYGIQGIPFTVLLDREGKVLATNLRGEALEAKLKEILG